MNGLNNLAVGGKHYNECLKSAEEKGDIGIHKHMHIPTAPTSRLGFVGKKVSKKTKAELAKKLLNSSLTRPELRTAAINMARYLQVK